MDTGKLSSSLSEFFINDASGQSDGAPRTRNQIAKVAMDMALRRYSSDVAMAAVGAWINDIDALPNAEIALRRLFAVLKNKRTDEYRRWDSRMVQGGVFPEEAKSDPELDFVTSVESVVAEIVRIKPVLTVRDRACLHFLLTKDCDPDINRVAERLDLLSDPKVADAMEYLTANPNALRQGIYHLRLRLQGLMMNSKN